MGRRAWRKTGDRGQIAAGSIKTDGRGQKIEVRDQTSEVRGKADL
jgi:hypothetical protein